MNEALKHRLYAQIVKIHDIDIKRFTVTALDNAPAEFWIAPCSSTGKHHPPEDNGEGGLIRHLLKCIEISVELARFYDISETNTDIVVSAAILHDIQKNGIPWGNRTDPTHGKIAYTWLAQFPLKEPEKEAIRDCIRYHYARWVEPAEDLTRALYPTKNEHIIQLTDYFCSRECASFLPGVNVPKAAIERFSK